MTVNTDILNTLTPDEEGLLQRKERLIQIMVSERVTDPSIRDDVLQEARIRLIQVSRAKPDHGESYWHKAMNYRIREVSTRGNWTGHEGRRGWQDAHRSKGRLSLNQQVASGDGDGAELGETLIIEDLSATEALHEVEFSYHHGRIAEAIASLSPRHRAYVMQRFWGGRTHEEMGAEMGVSDKTLWGEWDSQIRPALREALGDLREVVYAG